MRLVQRSDSGDFVLTQIDDDSIPPPYAILSHTWGTDAEEVTFDDLTNNTGKDKPGYEKIGFCAEQAARDNLEYFWIDTCCINKENNDELSHAINSMFCWYRKATRCYAYLPDVSTTSFISNRRKKSTTQWEPAFRKSRWFTRGWTLQELLAPASVEFFSLEGKRLGDKSSLSQQIHEITAIPGSALQGAPPSQFSVNERISWINKRQTKLEEDKAYSLLGILDVHIPPIYGEGMDSAFRRLREEIGKQEKCMQDLHLTNPRNDKKRIEDNQGGLLEDSYHWILENADFRQWRNNENSRLLWIKGDPGKGKTMLLCGIIEELQKSIAKTDLLSYFFCQATDSRINSATAVLRGLLYLLVKQQPSLVLHIQKEHDHAGKALFENANAWVALSEIFTSILQDPSLNSTFLIVDALDECVTDLPKLLDFVAQKPCVSSRVKWIVSSRNWPVIEKELDPAMQKVRVCLELHEDSVSAAVGAYIRFKVDWLAKRNKYDDKTRDAVEHYLSLNAKGTFLWVALVCQELTYVSEWKVQKKLTAFPPGLDALYRRMMDQIHDSEDANLCERILAVVSTVYRPVTLDELVSFVDMPNGVSGNYEALCEVIGLCGSFLTLRERTVSFVHQSAKDFLSQEASSKLFPCGMEGVHYSIFSKSLQIMSTLRRDMYSLHELGYPAELVEPPDPDPLATLCYSCIYWIDHLGDWSLASAATSLVDLQDSGAIHKFLREKFLYWLEALSLCKSLPDGVVSIAKLKALVDGRADAAMLNKLVQDAHRFIMAHKGAIENSPLQAYASALLFSPASSLVRGHFKEEEPQWITIKPSNVTGDQWSACLSTLEGHRGAVNSVAFSHDSTRLASASDDKTVKVWDVGSSACLLTLKGHRNKVWSVAFSHESTRLASASPDTTVKIWDAGSGTCLLTLEGHSNSVSSVAFSHDSARLASASWDMTVKIWDTGSGTCVSTLEDAARSVAFSHNSAWLASASSNNTVKIWDAGSGACLSTLEWHSSEVFSEASSVAFSYDSARLALASLDKTVKIWDPSSGTCLSTLEGHRDAVLSVAFSHNSTQLASASYDKLVKIWDLSSSTCLLTLEGHSAAVRSVAFSYDSARLASASDDKTVKIWDLSSGACLSTLKHHHDKVYSVAFSHNSAWLASASYDKLVKIWDPSSGTCLSTLEGYHSRVWSMAFSYDSARLASASDNTIKIWDPSSGTCLSTFEGHSNTVWSVAFSYDSAQLASASDDKTVKTWDLSSGACLLTLEGHSGTVWSIAFSRDLARLASASDDNAVKIWDPSSGTCLSTLEGHRDWVRSVAFSYDSTRLASASDDKTVKIWDPSSGVCLSTLNVGWKLNRISFNHTSSYLYTEIGTISLRNPLDSTAPLINAEVQQPQHKGIALSSDGVWITYNSKMFIWLPSEYRPYCSAVLDNTISVGVGSGRVWFVSTF